MFENMNTNPFMMPDQNNYIGIDNNFGDIDIDIMQNNSMNTQGMMQNPIIEPMQERVVNRTIEHVVPHVCPVRTRIINHHVFRHTYSPSYSCCEENVCENVQCGSCCNY